MRGLANRSEGLANRSEGLARLGPVDKIEGLGGRAGLGPVDKCEGLGAGLAWALSTSGTHAQAHTISSLTLQQMARMRSLEE